MDPFIHLYIDPFIHLSMNLSIYQSIISSIQLKFLSTYISYLPILNKKGGNLVSCIQMFMYVIFCTVKTFRLPCISLPRFVHNLRYQLSGTQWFRGTTPGFFKKKRCTFQNRGRIQYLYHTNGATKLSSWELTYHLFGDHL